MGVFFNNRVAASALYRIITVGSGCATLATYIADNVDGFGTTLTVGIVVLSVMIGMLLFIAVSELQGEEFVFKRCKSCNNVQKKIPSWIKGTVSAKALMLLRMEVVIFSTYFALSYADSVYNTSQDACTDGMPSRPQIIGGMILACFIATSVSLIASSRFATRAGGKCCTECTLNTDNRFVTTRLA